MSHAVVHSQLTVLLEKCWQEFCGHKLTLQTESLILSLDGNILLKLLWLFFFFLFITAVVCPFVLG